MLIRIPLFFFFVFFVSPISSSELPDLGASDLKDYDAQTETALGRSFSTALHQYYDLMYDPIVLSYIRRIGSKITSETGNARHYNFFIINDSEINAFAGPNGVIGINTGLIMASESEDELASVVAHEVAHVTQRHLSRTYEYQSDLNIASIGSLIAAILIGTQDPGAGIATYMGAMGATIQEQLRNSRIHESEADYFGIKYLYKSGYNPMAMSDFFGRLDKASQLYEYQTPEILRTHPVTENRLARAKDRAKQFSNTGFPYQSGTLRLIQVRLEFLKQGQVNSFRSGNLTPVETCYLKNLQMLSNSQKFKPDTECLNQAINQHPNERLLLILQAQINFRLDPEMGSQNFKFLQAIYPSDFSIPLLYAKSLKHNQQVKKAIDILKTKTPSFHYQYLLYSTLAQYLAEQRQTKYVYYYDALANYNIGNIQKSVHLINQAKLLEKNKKSRLYEKLTQIENEISPMLKPRPE